MPNTTVKKQLKHYLHQCRSCKHCNKNRKNENGLVRCQRYSKWVEENNWKCESFERCEQVIETPKPTLKEKFIRVFRCFQKNR